MGNKAETVRNQIVQICGQEFADQIDQNNGGLPEKAKVKIQAEFIKSCLKQMKEVQG